MSRLRPTTSPRHADRTQHRIRATFAPLSAQLLLEIRSSTGPIRVSCHRIPGQPLLLGCHDLTGELNLRDVDGVRADLGDLTASRIVVEQPGLHCEQFDHPLIHAVLDQQPVGLDRSDLAHAMEARDRLLLQGGLDLRFANHDDVGGLDVQSHPAGLDLGEQDRVAIDSREPVHKCLPRRRRNVARDRAESGTTQRITDGREHVAEEGEYDDLAAIGRALMDDL